MKVIFLGTGTSTGVPQIGCNCEVCTSNNPKDKRLRTSVMIECDDINLLIDCGPDFREQILRNYHQHIDAVLITHEHFDHVGGLDDLRPYCYPESLDVYAEEDTIDKLKKRLPYCFREHLYPGVPHFNMCEVTMNKFWIKNIGIIPIRVMHYQMPILGYRIGNMAYITDLKKLPEEEFDKLKDLDTLIINALQIKEHLSHQSLSDALGIVRRVMPKHAYLIHMSHKIGLHEKVEAELPPNVHLAYDNLEIEVK